LRSAYVNSLKLALEHGIRRIAFPAISTGVYGYPKDQAAHIAIAAGLEFAPRMDAIIYCCFREQDAALYQRILQETRA
jgi:O-acetyl-ADP-ribose deacetylase (regulator of RNase III)